MDSKNAVALAVGLALTSGGVARAAESLEEVVVESTYTTGDRLELFKLFTTYKFIDALPALKIGGGVNWGGGNYTATTNPITGAPERLEQGVFALVHLMARYAISETISGQLNVDNLLNEKYYDQIDFYDQLAFGEPRNYNIAFTYRF